MANAVETETTQNYDVLVLGSGEAGKYLAWRLAADGKQVALVERRYVGGSCPNIACLPSKNVIHSAKVAWYLRRAESFGLPQNDVGVNMQIVRQRKRDMVSGLVDLNQQRFVQTGVDLILGEGRFTGPRTMEVRTRDGTERVLTGDVVIVSTGSRSSMPPVPGLAEAEPMTHIEALELDVVPRHLAVMGGGYIGLELAQAARRFGSEVTVIDRNARVLSREDEDTAAALGSLLEAEGIRFALGTSVRSVLGKSGEGVELELETPKGPDRLEASHVLVATGRVPNNSGIGLESAGVELTESGHIRVDEHLRTSAENVFAVGDCAGSPHFTHIALDDNRVVYETLHGRERSTKNRQVPFCMFTDPELAHVGLREREAREQGMPYRLLKLPMSAALRTRTLGETDGFFKALIGGDDRILGFTAVGTSAGEMIAPVQVAMAAGLPYTALRDAIFTHPTLTEGLVYLFASKPVDVAKL